MDVLLWIGWFCTVVVLFFMVAVGLFGSLALKAPSWDLEFLALAYHDWTRRGLTDRKHSMSEELHMQRYIGHKQVAEEPDLEERGRIVRTIAVLIGSNDHDALQAQLDTRSHELLMTALTSVFRSVENISNLNVASRVWVLRRWAALSVVLWHGLKWFLPRCFRQVARVIERYMAAATILGIAGGLLVWGFSRDLSESKEGGIAWVNFVGVVVTVGTVVALVLAVGRQFWQVAVAVIGPVHTWTRKGIMSAALLFGFTAGMITLVRTGAWEQWQRDASKFLTELLMDTPAGDWVGKILFIAVIMFMIYRSFQWARAKRIKVSDRITAVGAAIFFTSMGVLLILFIFDAPREVVLPVLYATGHVIAFFGLLNAIFSVAGWIGKYRALRRAGIEIRRGWFRWWILWTWISVAIALSALASIPPLAYAALNDTPYYLPFTAVTMLATLALFLSFWPGAFTVVRFVIRVHNTYTRHEFELGKIQLDATLSAATDDQP
ncbi:hypothetical protein QFZ53_003706 [Microbacterium natoriense]|uniref:Uncharacterized protein n=1 Tax=Microbacterium natoriense TaxID=284570 RepID=A0AAW8F176_9MICO|nr:hypothetical protein [Microbacterium natoriense]MDQ0649510.1 hypothetical protein [Microbacterium natoriense]